MTKAIVKAEQSELAKLVEQREELSSTLTNLKRRLRSLPAFDRSKLEGYQANQREGMRQRLMDAQDNLADWENAESLRLQLLEMSEGTPKVQDLLRQSGYGSFAWHIEHEQESVEYLTEQLANDPEPIVDPHIEVTNGIATVEYKLAEVRAQIKGLMPK